MPTVSLEIGPEALAMLTRSRLVTRIYLAEERDRSNVRPEVSAQVADTGAAKVGVELAGQWLPEGLLSPDDARQQRQAIGIAHRSYSPNSTALLTRCARPPISVSSGWKSAPTHSND